jgi:hypothetical protein
MNIFKSNKLFPNIRGVMLKDKRITLTMSGKVKVTSLRDGADSRIELFFSNHEKSALINGNQSLVIADVYGPETDDWKDKPIVLYGEEGEVVLANINGVFELTFSKQKPPAKPARPSRSQTAKRKPSRTLTKSPSIPMRNWPA